MAIQFNSGNNTWNGFLVDLYKAQKGIVDISSESDSFFKKFENNGRNLSDVISKVFAHDTFDDFIEKHKLADESLTGFLKDTQYSTKNLSTYKQYLQDTAKSTSGFARIAKSAGSVIKSLGASFASAAISMGVSFIASKAIEGISYAMNYSKNLADSAKGAGEAITQTDKDIDSYKDKITELQGVLNDNSSTVEEVTSAKQQLLDIQNELTEKYGSEASGIDLVSGSLAILFSRTLNAKIAPENQMLFELYYFVFCTEPFFTISIS